jgi:hypothetical protein
MIVECLSAIYGMMVAALLHCKKFVKSLTKHGFKLNPYDVCVANKIVKGKQRLLFVSMLMIARSPTNMQMW